VFHDNEGFSSYSISDLGRAKDFYGGKLGLDVKESEMGTLEVKLGSGQRVTLYTKPNHEPATFTVLNFFVSDIDKAVDDLTGQGITMERYDNIPDINQDAKGIARDAQGPAIAWFTDPDRNVIAVLQR
jgi:hypothetical protein